MNRAFVCWVLVSPEGSVAYYDSFSGLLVNGTFHSDALDGSLSYSMQIIGTAGGFTSTLEPNTHAPSIVANPVSPESGNSPTPFTFSMTYTDQDNNGPIWANVTINGTIYTLVKANPADFTYTDGCVFQITLYLQPGSYQYNFSASDGLHTFTTTTQGGLNVTNWNSHAPKLAAGIVNPPAGYNDTTPFTYSVTYSDADNNQPVQITVVINGTSHAMIKQVPSASNYIAGCVFVYTTKNSTIGTSNYLFNASDGVYTATIGPFNGPVVSLYHPLWQNGAGYNYTVYQDLSFSTTQYSYRFTESGNGTVDYSSTWTTRTFNASTGAIDSNEREFCGRDARIQPHLHECQDRWPSRHLRRGSLFGCRSSVLDLGHDGART